MDGASLAALANHGRVSCLLHQCCQPIVARLFTAALISAPAAAAAAAAADAAIASYSNVTSDRLIFAQLRFL